MAIGGDLAFRSTNHGASWIASAQGIATGADLGSVTCPSGTTCIAVGARGLSAAVYRSVNGGMVWHSIVAPPGVGPLGLVACATSTFCVATGNPLGVLLSTDGGAHWSVKTFPKSWNTSGLSGLSCVAGVCMGVGSYNSGRAYDIVITNQGARWHLHTPAVLKSPLSVQCVSASTCWAEGIYQDAGMGSIPGVYKTLDRGTTWSLLSTPNTGDPGFVVCASRVCHQVGTGPVQYPLIDQLATSTDGGVKWTSDHAAPAVMQVFDIVHSGNQWIAVGENAFGGPLVITSS
jgi:hypothetical protein